MDGSSCRQKADNKENWKSRSVVVQTWMAHVNIKQAQGIQSKQNYISREPIATCTHIEDAQH